MSKHTRTPRRGPDDLEIERRGRRGRQTRWKCRGILLASLVSETSWRSAGIREEKQEVECEYTVRRNGQPIIPLDVPITYALSVFCTTVGLCMVEKTADEIALSYRRPGWEPERFVDVESWNYHHYASILLDMEAAGEEGLEPDWRRMALTRLTTFELAASASDYGLEGLKGS